MPAQSDSFQSRNSYIPPSVQKSMAAHMERIMPNHLKQYQGSGTHMPARIEHEMTVQMQKNLPAHMQEYVEPYMQQNIIFGPNNSSDGPGQLRTDSPLAQAFKPVRTQVILPNDSSSRRPLRATASTQATINTSGQRGPASDSPYEFIMNPGQPPKKPMIDLGGASTFKRAILVGAGLIILIILVTTVFSFLNGAGNAHKEKLIELAQTQEEIIRVAEAAREKIGDRNVLFKAHSVRLTVSSSQQDILGALALRGEKKLDKKLAAGQNPENDAVLLQGEQNGNFDETYQALLDQQLSNYGLQLQSVYEGSTSAEKQSIETAYNQIELLTNKKSASGQ